jgi:hypothetical protein
MTGPPIGVQGAGVAALCCLRLLDGQAHRMETSAEAAPGCLPSLLVSQSTQKLLADIFRDSHLFDAAPRIRQRVVAWGSREPVALPHEAIVISEDALLQLLDSRLQVPPTHTTASLDWTILTARSAPALASAAYRHFGARTAQIHRVDLTPHAEPETCWIESTPQGWLFLLATGSASGSLLAVGDSAASLLAHSSLVAAKVQQLHVLAGEFPAYPRILGQLCATGWLACGSAAMAFDPLCGEGTGNAAREAILACAAARAIQEGESAEAVLSEYDARLKLGFLRHLENCREFYVSDFQTEFWPAARHGIEQGLAWTRGQFAAGQSPKFRLVDFALRRIAK